MEKEVKLALEHGFSQAAPLDAATLNPLDAVRDMCAAGKCNKYGRCWTCPPGCGTIEQNRQEMARFTKGIIVQTTRKLEDEFDVETMTECGAAHGAQFRELSFALRKEYPGLLALGAGGCTLCETCTYPDAPCRRPGEALSSMEAYGLLVSEVCQKNGILYYYGPSTMTYTGCYLLE